jgi:DNA-binding beta-propeller fold protein YncE
VSPSGAYAYVAGSSDNAVAMFDRDAGNEKLSFIEREKDGIDDPFDSGGVVDGLFGAKSVAVSPDGAHVYAAGSSDDAVAAFATVDD